MDVTEPGKRTLFMTQNVLYGVIAGIGILANIFVIVVLVIWEKSRPNRTVANLFIINLAIADLLFLVYLPLSMPALIDNGWIYGSFMCKLTEVIKYFNFRASICFLTTMTIDRYLAIVHSLKSRGYRTRRNATKLCVLLWLIVIAISMPLMIYTDEYDVGGTKRCEVHFPGYKATYLSRDELYEEFNITLDDSDEYTIYGTESDEIYFTFNNFSSKENSGSEPEYLGIEGDDSNTCTDRAHTNSTSHTVWVFANFVIFFLLPMLAVIFCYGSIITATVTRKISSTTSGGVQNRVAVMVGFLVSVFIICWLPFQVFELAILPPGLQLQNSNDCLVLKTIFEMLAWSNSAINPILYSISSKQFRNKAIAAWTFIRHGKTRALAFQSSQRTLQTRLHTTTGSSIKGMMVATPKDKPTTPNLSGRSSPVHV